MAEDTKPPAKIIIDASVMLCRFLPDEKQFSQKIADYFHQYEKGEIDFAAPVLLKFEITNALKSAVLQKRLTLELAGKLLEQFILLQVEYLNVEFKEILKLAVKHQISAFDASYVLLATCHKLPLVTLDKKLAQLASFLS